MAAARRAFLGKGYYEALSDRIVALVGNETDGAGILDAGCGEGYYLRRLLEFLPGGEGYGLDISKEVVRLAARDKGASYVVASVHRDLPFGASSLDIILNVFAPRSPAEFARVLRPGGVALVVVPAAGHLAALHDVLGLPHIDGDKERRAVADFDGALALSHSETLRYTRDLPPADVFDLIQMTPTFWHLSDGARAGLQSLPGLAIEFAFTLIVLCRAPVAATRE